MKANEKDVSTFTKHQETRFTPQQYQALLALIQQPSHAPSASHSAHINQIGSITSSSAHTSQPSGSVQPLICTTHCFDTTPWIIDSGAIDHVTCSLQFFTSYKLIKPVIVNLPTGHKVTTTHSGIVYFSSNF